MDTPKKTQQPQQQVGTPLASRFEDSPVFNFINSLSPIKPVKSVHIAQTFQSINFTSIPSIFTSPHVNPQKESRFLVRHPLSDLSKPEFSSDSGLCTGVSHVFKLSGHADRTQADGKMMCSLNEAVVDPPDEISALPSKNPSSLQYNCSSPDHNTAPCFGGKMDFKLVLGSTSLIEFVHDDLEETNSEAVPEDMLNGQDDDDHIQEVLECDWDSLMPDDPENMLIFDVSNESESSKELVQHFSDHDPNLVSLSEDTINSSNELQADCVHYLQCQSALQELPVNHNNEIAEQNETDHTPLIFCDHYNKPVGIESHGKMDDGTGDYIPFDSKVDSQQQRGMRRRCLVFEMGGTHRKKLHNNVNQHFSNSSAHYVEFSSDLREPVSSKPGVGMSHCILPSIGLHLNALASVSRDIMASKNSIASEKHLSHAPYSINSLPSVSSNQVTLYDSSSVEKDSGSSGAEIRDIQVTQDNSQENAVGEGEVLNHDSPRKKRRKAESASESEGCKRCNCKKSKCLKLYCECFAAGVYCVEPCTCQGCFNKPMHEDTVLATRKQIESRNPLAFAPKVIRTSEPPLEVGEEANKTPASVRHKRGCNCKKSNCLKKYCECFQGGAGCSISCRCEGCKNTFGRKNGTMPMVVDETEKEKKELDASEVAKDKIDSERKATAKVQNDERQCPENSLPITPSSQILRSSIHQPFLCSGKPPRSSMLSIGSTLRLNAPAALRNAETPLSEPKFEKHLQHHLEDDTPEILRGNATTIGGVKVASPNRKRISPPHKETGVSSADRKRCRKLILKSIPSFPSLTCDTPNEIPTTLSGGPLDS